jgi:hypothetical protein
MKSTFTFSAFTAALICAFGVSAICCVVIQGGCARRSIAEGRTFAADVYVPATLRERDVVVLFESDMLDKRAVICCCFASSAQNCEQSCDNV